MLEGAELLQFERLVSEWASAALADERQRGALRDALASIQSSYANDIVDLARRKQEREAKLRDFVKQHKRDFSEAQRSYEFAGWRVGLRKKPDAVKVPRDEDGVIAKLREKCNFLFVRPSYSIDREALLRFLSRETDDELGPLIQNPRPVERMLEDLGIMLKRGADKFFVEGV